MKTNEMTLGQKLSKIQQEFKSKKSRYNSFGKYNFRSAEDILEALKPFNEKYDVYFTISEDLIQPEVLKSIASIVDATLGLEISCSSIVGIDMHQKGMQMPQKYGSASSYAKKYALGNLLLIDDTLDSDGTNDHGKKSKAVVNKSVSNKPLLDTTSFRKALTFVQSGGSIEQIKAKYTISPDFLKKLEA